MFKLEFQTANQAFSDGFLQDETARILQEIIKKLNRGHTGGKCMDVNGNTVGQWSLK